MAVLRRILKVRRQTELDAKMAREKDLERAKRAEGRRAAEVERMTRKRARQAEIEQRKAEAEQQRRLAAMQKTPPPSPRTPRVRTKKQGMRFWDDHSNFPEAPFAAGGSALNAIRGKHSGPSST